MRRLFQYCKSISIVNSLTVSLKFFYLFPVTVPNLYGFQKRRRRFHSLSLMVDNLHTSHICNRSGSLFVISSDIIAFRNYQFLNLINTVFDIVRKYNLTVFICIKNIILIFITVTASVRQIIIIVFSRSRIT